MYELLFSLHVLHALIGLIISERETILFLIHLLSQQNRTALNMWSAEANVSDQNPTEGSPLISWR